MTQVHRSCMRLSTRHQSRGVVRCMSTVLSKECRGHNGGMREQYMQAIQAKKIEPDSVQLRTLQQFEDLIESLRDYCGPQKRSRNYSSDSFTSFSWLPALLRQGSNGNDVSDFMPQKAPRGLYLHGGVGCGKTFLMDLFHEIVAVEKKKRVHFHTFMLQIHREIHQSRQEKHKDIILYTIDKILDESWLLCLDELQITDVADAMIMQRIFTGLFERGCVMVATSNRPPQDLYKNGIQRDLFLPFVDLLQDKCHVISLNESTTDYRMKKAQSDEQILYMYPRNDSNGTKFEQAFQKIAGGQKITEMTLNYSKRILRIPQAIEKAPRACKVSFGDMCNKAYSASDYLLIADTFAIVFMQDIPRLSFQNLDPLRRFITFIDCMYDRRMQLYCLADAAPEKLLDTESKCSKQYVDEVFAFDRTVSRLIEMSSVAYLNDCIQRRNEG